MIIKPHFLCTIDRVETSLNPQSSPKKNRSSLFFPSKLEINDFTTSISEKQIVVGLFLSFAFLETRISVEEGGESYTCKSEWKFERIVQKEKKFSFIFGNIVYKEGWI